MRVLAEPNDYSLGVVLMENGDSGEAREAHIKTSQRPLKSAGKSRGGDTLMMASEDINRVDSSHDNCHHLKSNF